MRFEKQQETEIPIGYIDGSFNQLLNQYWLGMMEKKRTEKDDYITCGIWGWPMMHVT